MSQQDPALVQLEGQLASLSRRRFLKTGLIVGTSAAAVVTYPARVFADTSVPTYIKHLSATEYRLFNKLREVFLPTERFSDLPSTTEVPVMENLDNMIGRLNSDTRFLLSLGTKTLEFSTLYKMTRFSSLSNEQALQQVRVWQSGLALQGGLIVSLKTLLGVAYWRDPRTWPALEYDGPVTKKWGIRRLGNMPVPRDQEENIKF
ncbi:MAG: transcriptional initiation protein Tat [Moraxellaceae bacterium]|nr:transcriptional initiation protein Tat [Moraxellaceae bacterium]